MDNITENKPFDFPQVQYKDQSGNWIDMEWIKDIEHRYKPKVDFQKEIDALQKKAKESGMKAIINFEKL